MSDEAALLRAIHANPDDDTPRLVYADWLDEHDQPERAEFIRVQIELEGIDNHQTGKGYELSRREVELREAHEQKWIAYLPPFGGTLIFHRGFPEVWHTPDEDLSDLATIRHHIPGLRRLTIHGTTITPEALRVIATFPQLDLLDIRDTVFEPDWLELLDPLPSWTRIRIVYDDYTPERERIAGWEDFQERRIRRVTELAPEQQRTAAVRFLRSCDLWQTPVRPGRAVTRLHFHKERVTDSELRFLSYLPELEELVIDQGAETDAGLWHLSGLQSLKKFIVSSTQYESLLPLMNCTTLEHLEYHSLGSNFGDDCVVGLERLTNLQHLALCPESNGLGDATLRRIGALINLRTLWVEFGALEDESSLAPLANLTKLESLLLTGQYHVDYTGVELQHFLERLRQQ